MAYKVFTDGSVLTASEVNDYLMRQSVVKCTDVTRPSSPDEGMVVWETNTDRLLYYSGAAWVIITEPRQTWTPTISQLGVISGTVNRGWYRRNNGHFDALLTFTAGGPGTAANDIAISSPLTLADANDAVGEFWVQDVGTTRYSGTVLSISTTSLRLQSDANNGYLGTAPGYTIATNDVIRLRLEGTY